MDTLVAVGELGGLIALWAFVPVIERINNPELKKWVRRFAWILFIIGLIGLARFMCNASLKNWAV